jgi:hypothetical protein
MAATLEAVQSTKTVDKQTETSEADAARELVRMAKEQGLSLTGPDGLLKMLTKTVIEAALDEEMTEHLGYGKRETEAKETANSRNGTRAKTVLTETTGPVVTLVKPFWLWTAGRLSAPSPVLCGGGGDGVVRPGGPPSPAAAARAGGGGGERPAARRQT